jgi:hypothetical protein
MRSAHFTRRALKLWIELESQIVSEWQPMETCPVDTWVLLYAPWMGGERDANMYVGRRRVLIEREDVLVSEKGNRRTYERRDVRKDEWDGGGWGGDGWMPLPLPPVDRTGDN